MVKSVNGSATRFLYDGPNVAQERSDASVNANVLSGISIGCGSIAWTRDGETCDHFTTRSRGPFTLRHVAGVGRVSFGIVPLAYPAAWLRSSSRCSRRRSMLL